MLHGAWVSGGIKIKRLTASRGGVYGAGGEKWPRSGRVAELTGPGERHQKAAEMRRKEKREGKKEKSQERENNKSGENGQENEARKGRKEKRERETGAERQRKEEKGKGSK